MAYKDVSLVPDAHRTLAQTSSDSIDSSFYSDRHLALPSAMPWYNPIKDRTPKVGLILIFSHVFFSFSAADMQSSVDEQFEAI